MQQRDGTAGSSAAEEVRGRGADGAGALAAGRAAVQQGGPGARISAGAGQGTRLQPQPRAHTAAAAEVVTRVGQLRVLQRPQLQSSEPHSEACEAAGAEPQQEDGAEWGCGGYQGAGGGRRHGRMVRGRYPAQACANRRR